MKEVKRTVIPLLPRSSGRALCWRGDALVDWQGIFEYRLDGTSSDTRVSVAYRFDRAVTSASGEAERLFIVGKTWQAVHKTAVLFIITNIYQPSLLIRKIKGSLWSIRKRSQLCN